MQPELVRQLTLLVWAHVFCPAVALGLSLAVPGPDWLAWSLLFGATAILTMAGGVTLRRPYSAGPLRSQAGVLGDASKLQPPSTISV
jgi:hypothetical protein